MEAKAEMRAVCFNNVSSNIKILAGGILRRRISGWCCNEFYDIIMHFGQRMYRGR
jgi:hypothetical protein